MTKPIKINIHAVNSKGDSGVFFAMNFIPKNCYFP